MFSSFMINAWEAATVVAVVAGVVGFFTVLRGAAFAAHSLPNGAFAGAAGAFLIGANTIVGLGVFSLAGAGMIAGLGRRARSDVATALTIVLMLALGDLFLSRTSEYAPEIFALLFGEVLGVSTSKLGPTVVIAAICILAVIVLYRPLMLSSVAPDVAEARGINPRVMDLAFLVVLALVTTMAVPVVGSLLISACSSARPPPPGPSRTVPRWRWACRCSSRWSPCGSPSPSPTRRTYLSASSSAPSAPSPTPSDGRGPPGSKPAGGDGTTLGTERLWPTRAQRTRW